jgi:hypothetical protein
MAKTHNVVSQAYTVSLTAVSLQTIGFSAAQVAGAQSLAVTGDTVIRYLGDQTPTATFGHIIAAGETVEFIGGDFADMEFIRGSGTDSVATFTLETRVDV